MSIKRELLEPQFIHIKRDKITIKEFRILDYSILVVPFKKHSINNFIYDGEEKMVFNQRDKHYRDILMKEFGNF